MPRPRGTAQVSGPDRDDPRRRAVGTTLRTDSVSRENRIELHTRLLARTDSTPVLIPGAALRTGQLPAAPRREIVKTCGCGLDALDPCGPGRRAVCIEAFLQPIQTERQNTPGPALNSRAMTRDPGEIVRTGYDRVAARYRALEHDSARWPRTEWIAELTRRLRPGAAVLDLGCAAGVPVAAELASRYRVTGVDISRNISSRLPGMSRTLSSSAPTRVRSPSRPGTSTRSFPSIPSTTSPGTSTRISSDAFAAGCGLTACSC